MGVFISKEAQSLSANTMKGNTVTSSKWSAFGGGIFIENSSATISNNTLTGNTARGGYSDGEGGYGYGGGIYVEGGTVTISYNTITENRISGGGAAIYYKSSGDIMGNLIANNVAEREGILEAIVIGGNPTLTGNTIIDNKTPYTIYYAEKKGSPNLNATKNYWGVTTEAEIRVNIYDFFADNSKAIVDVVPFLLSPNTDAPVISLTGLTATVEGTAINLTWEAINLDDLAGYKVYYDTDSEEHPYEGTEATEGKSPVDVGKVTSYKLSGLKPGTKYYIAITAYDTQGNEGWYGEVVTIETAEGELKPPLPPELSSPDDGVVINIDTKNVVFKWAASEDVTSMKYSIQIAKDSKFSEILIDTSPGNRILLFLVALGNLKNLETYYW